MDASPTDGLTGVPQPALRVRVTDAMVDRAREAFHGVALPCSFTDAMRAALDAALTPDVMEVGAAILGPADVEVVRRALDRAAESFVEHGCASDDPDVVVFREMAERMAG